MSSTHLTTPHSTAAGVRAPAGARRAARSTRHDFDALWLPRERAVTAVLLAAGVALIGVAWLGASDTTEWDTQLRWTALSMVGVVVVCVGVGIWLSRGFARVRTETRTVRRALAARLAPATPARTSGQGVRVTVAGMTHHHRPDCLLVTGKVTVPADESAPRACGVCA